MHQVLELCCFEWFQNQERPSQTSVISFRAVLFRMVPKHAECGGNSIKRFRAVLFRMVPKPLYKHNRHMYGFRAVLFRMVPKP